QLIGYDEHRSLGAGCAFVPVQDRARAVIAVGRVGVPALVVVVPEFKLDDSLNSAPVGVGVHILAVAAELRSGLDEHAAHLAEEFCQKGDFVFVERSVDGATSELVNDVGEKRLAFRSRVLQVVQWCRRSGHGVSSLAGVRIWLGCETQAWCWPARTPLA